VEAAGQLSAALDTVLSSNWIWQAGRPYARKLNMTRFADGRQPAQGSVTIFLEPRDGSLRMDSQNYINLRAEKQFRFGRSRRATAMVDVINLLKRRYAVDADFRGREQRELRETGDPLRSAAGDGRRAV
jgi:hypothetical protein